MRIRQEEKQKHERKWKKWNKGQKRKKERDRSEYFSFFGYVNKSHSLNLVLSFSTFLSFPFEAILFESCQEKENVWGDWEFSFGVTSEFPFACFFQISFQQSNFQVMASKRLSPFLLVDTLTRDDAGCPSKLCAKYVDLLSPHGFQCLATLPLFDGTAEVAVFTSEKLQEAAANSDRGSYGATFRMSFTDVKGEIQVVLSETEYWSAAFRMDERLASLADEIRAVVLDGKEGRPFGSAKGMSESSLRKYHYAIGMPGFRDGMALAKYDTFEEAVASVERGLEACLGGVSKVYRLDLPGKKETVFGVAQSGEFSDEAILRSIDLSPVQSTAHLPYEIVVTSKGCCEALSPKFRIALSFPDLPMVGPHSFASIMSCPTVIEKSLKLAARAKVDGKK